MLKTLGHRVQELPVSQRHSPDMVIIPKPSPLSSSADASDLVLFGYLLS